MNNRLHILCATLIAATVVACSAVPRRKSEITDPGALLFNGYVGKSMDCYACHSGDASGTWKGSNLVGIGKRKSREEIVQAILLGPSIMPSYESKLTDTEVGEIVDWLVGLE